MKCDTHICSTLLYIFCAVSLPKFQLRSRQFDLLLLLKGSFICLLNHENKHTRAVNLSHGRYVCVWPQCECFSVDFGVINITSLSMCQCLCVCVAKAVLTVCCRAAIGQ